MPQVKCAYQYIKCVWDLYYLNYTNCLYHLSITRQLSYWIIVLSTKMHLIFILTYQNFIVYKHVSFYFLLLFAYKMKESLNNFALKRYLYLQVIILSQALRKDIKFSCKNWFCCFYIKYTATKESLKILLLLPRDFFWTEKEFGEVFGMSFILLIRNS